MSRLLFLRKPHEKDFLTYTGYLNTRGSITIGNEILTPYLKAIHRKTYYLNGFIQHLSPSNTLGKFLKEVVVDLILIMDLYSLNYMKNVRMNLRSAIEEFNRYLLLEKEFDVSDLSISKINEQLLELYKDNPIIHSKISMLCSDYAELCSFIHVVDNHSFTHKLVLSDFQNINRREAEKIARQVNRNIENFLLILIFIHKTSFLTLNKHMQAYILQQLPYADQQSAVTFIES